MQSLPATTVLQPGLSAEQAFALWERHKRALYGYWPYSKEEMEAAVSYVAGKVMAEFGFLPQLPNDAGLLGPMLEKYFGWPAPGKLYQQAFGYVPIDTLARDELSPAAAAYSRRFSLWFKSLSGEVVPVPDSIPSKPVKSAVPTPAPNPAAPNKNYELF